MNGDIQSVQHKSGPYFNKSNLFAKICMLYYTSNLYLQQVLKMMIEYLAVSLVLTLTSAADWDFCPKVNPFYGILSSFSQ